MDSLFLEALSCKPTPRAPVWLMRQAGRYLKEYRELKQQYTFLELCNDPELASQVTLMPMKRFELDASILFADILLILQTLDFEIGFESGQGPWINTKQYLDKVDSIPLYSPAEVLSSVGQTVSLLKKELLKPLIGFCGAPFTLATYLLEGKTSRSFEKTKEWIYSKPNQLHYILKLLTHQSIQYLKMQIDKGVNAVQVFDSWAGFFPSEILKEFCFPYLGEIIEKIKPHAPVILFAKGSCQHVKELVKLNPSAISLDESMSLNEVATYIPPHIAIQGNLDPDLLVAPLEILKREVEKLCEHMKHRPGFIFNLGHGVKPQSKVENVQCLIETVQNISFLEPELQA